MNDAIFRELTIKWKGEEYRFVPTMKLMRSIEMGDISFADILARSQLGRPPVSHISYVLSRMLQAAGAKVTEDKVYLEISKGDQESINHLMRIVLIAFSPVEDNSKNLDAQTENQS